MCVVSSATTQRMCFTSLPAPSRPGRRARGVDQAGWGCIYIYKGYIMELSPYALDLLRIANLYLGRVSIYVCLKNKGKNVYFFYFYGIFDCSLYEINLYLCLWLKMLMRNFRKIHSNWLILESRDRWCTVNFIFMLIYIYNVKDTDLYH